MQLMLFTNDVELAQITHGAEVDRVVVDLERRGKSERQHGYHLELNDHIYQDITRIKESVPIKVMCRVNPLHEGSADEIENALNAGADVLMLPMFHAPKEAEAFVQMAGGRAKTSLLFETKKAVERARDFRDIGMDEVYVGLNDLSLVYATEFQYQLLADGVVDRVRSEFPSHDFGFGGITVLDLGRPLATRHILRELARLEATQVIVRRAFKRDMAGRNIGREVKRLQQYYADCLSRTPARVAQDHQEAKTRIRMIVEGAASGG